jgi:hypothetical protein
MQKLMIVVFFGLLALASASSIKYKRLTPVNPVPMCSVTEIIACVDEIEGK